MPRGVLLLPVCVLGRPLVLLPSAEGSALGTAATQHASREAAVAAVRAAAEAALKQPLADGESFLAGELGEHRIVVALAS